MKKALPVLIYCLLAFSLLGQVESGTIPISGGIAVQKTYSGENYESNFWGIAPSAGYFFNDYIGLIGGFSYSHTALKLQNFPTEGEKIEQSTGRFAVFLGLRSYFPIRKNRMFAQLDVSNTTISQPEFPDPLDRYSTFTSKIGVGANAWFNNNIALEANLKYTFFKSNTLEDQSYFGKGPIEFIVDIRPYLIERGDPPSNLADEFLDVGGFQVGGSAGFRHSLNDNDREINGVAVENDQVSIYASPVVGYFPAENWLTGLAGTLSYADDNANSPITYALSPYTRYYIRVADGLQLVPNFSFVYFYQLSRDKIRDQTNISRRVEFIPGIGLNIFIAEGLGLFANGSMSFVNRIDSDPASFVGNRSNVLQFRLGLEYYISAY
ncbi:MAG: outer membrane beta-barrel protein [Saprospiraceae bacterium]|nr:outer membrane beta-barrel protein [Saprospiraceae bacterium]